MSNKPFNRLSKNRLSKNKKGIIFTIDAVISMAIALVFLFSIFYYFSSAVDYSSSDLKVFAQDSLAVLEKSSAFIPPNNDRISAYVNNTPGQFCINISIYTPSETSFIKPGCSMQDLASVSVATRVFVSAKAPRYAKAMVWYNE